MDFIFAINLQNLTAVFIHFIIAIDNIHNPVIREESDIRKLAKAVKKELLGDTDDASRIGGAILQS